MQILGLNIPYQKILHHQSVLNFISKFYIFESSKFYSSKISVLLFPRKSTFLSVQYATYFKMSSISSGVLRRWVVREVSNTNTQYTLLIPYSRLLTLGLSSLFFHRVCYYSCFWHVRKNFPF